MFIYKYDSNLTSWLEYVFGLAYVGVVVVKVSLQTKISAKINACILIAKQKLWLSMNELVICNLK